MGFANLAMGCEFGNGFAKLAMGLRSWQWVCEVWQWVANLAMGLRSWLWVSEVGNGFAKLAMRNFAKVLKFYVRSEFRKCTVHVASEFRNAN